MVEKIIDGKKFTINDISYGDLLDLQDNCTVFDDENRSRMLRGKFTRELILRTVKDETGKPVNISDAKQCPMLVGKELDEFVGKILKEQEIKNN